LHLQSAGFLHTCFLIAVPSLVLHGCHLIVAEVKLRGLDPLQGDMNPEIQ